ncbi:MAG: hypothetical protein IE884_07015 [Sulfuricurvum sp.]|nr:hypothetical protein [Sulfuricurvum sp.]
MLSFFKRLFSSQSSHLPLQNLHKEEDNPSLKIFVAKEGGKYFQDFKLFHHKDSSTIDILLFLPHYGIFFGETLYWKASDLEHATVQRSTKQSKQPSATHLESIESKIRSKLQDVLSFDFTPIFRFIRLDHLSESEFDRLDHSFHEFLPKSSIIFNDDTIETVKEKLTSMGEYLHSPLSSIQIIGALQTHTFILPASTNPSGALLSPQQNQFLYSQLEKNTTLYGGYGSGKSTLLIRKAMLELLHNPQEKIVVFAPTILASDLLRNAFVSLMYYGAITIDLHRIVFASSLENLESFKPFLKATTVLCDDYYAMSPKFVDTLLKKCTAKRLLVVSIDENHKSDTNYPLTFSYRNPVSHQSIETNDKGLLPTLLSELRKSFQSDIPPLLILPESYDFSLFKETIDEYLGCNCRILTPSFTLQTQDIDDIIIATEEMASGIAASHVIIISDDPSKNYTYALSRGSETATIIFVSNPKRGQHE